MGAAMVSLDGLGCPSCPADVRSAGCVVSAADFRVPGSWEACGTCFAEQVADTKVNDQSPLGKDPRNLSTRQGGSPTPSSSSTVEEVAESPVKAALSQNQDFAGELRGLSPDSVKERIERLIEEWDKNLRVGIGVSLESEKVTVAFDPALQCLDVREHGSLFPLAALGGCTHLPLKPGGSFEILALFHNSEALTFQFERDHDRAAFALTLHALAAEARKDKWHEDWGEGWEDETEVGSATSYSGVLDDNSASIDPAEPRTTVVTQLRAAHNSAGKGDMLQTVVEGQREVRSAS